MRIPTTRPSREIAEAMIARLAPRYPQPVELDAEECTACCGTGRVEWFGMDIACHRCDGEGIRVPACECCGEPSTTVIFDGAPGPHPLCEEHALDTDYLDGLDLVTSIALRVLP